MEAHLISLRRAVRWAAQRSLLLLLGFSLAILVAEVLLRTIHLLGARPAATIDMELQELPEITDMWGLLKPNARGRYRDTLYASNSAGFRGPEFPVAKPPGTFRIVIVGDSFTMGSGVSYEESYPAVLAEALKHSEDTRNYEVLNLGISGLNLHANVLRLKSIGLQFDPDLVVYGYTVNDIEGPFYRKSYDRPAEDAGGATPLRVLNLLGHEWQNLRDHLWHPYGSYFWELDDNYFRNQQAWAAFQDDMADLARTAERSGICAGMLVHTHLQSLNRHHPFEAYYEAARTAARRAGVFVFESFPHFEGRRAGPLWVAYLDHHPNAEGHRILARALMDGLAALPEECWEGRPPLALEQLR